jgi:anti-sigma factor ChrR (cupin superfamily)
VPERPLKVDNLEFREFRESTGLAKGIQLSKLSLENCSATLVRYEAGAFVPKHKHSKTVLSVVLAGEISIGGKSYGAGSLIECTGEYGPRRVISEILLLVIQSTDTKYVSVE